MYIAGFKTGVALEAINGVYLLLLLLIVLRSSSTDTLIPYTSNHPPQHKYSAIRFLYNRLNSYHLEKDEYQKELDTIRHILRNNSFPIPSHTQHTPRRPPPLPPTTDSERKWSTFTYSSQESKYIMDLFRHSNVQVAFRTNNTLRNLLSHNTHHHDPFTQSGVYKLTCPDCGKAYIGQTGRDFTSRYHEHKRSFLNNSPTSNFARHLNDHQHSFGPIHNIMQVVHLHKKGPRLNTIERFHIHKETTIHNHLNDEHTITPNR